MAPLLTPFEIQSHLPEPHTLIHVKNLQTTLPIGTDAWGRPAKQQPVLLTCIVSLRQPFSSAASTDSVTKSTVHYGILSKSLLEACKRHYESITSAQHYTEDKHIYLTNLMDYIHWYLTGTDNGHISLKLSDNDTVKGEPRELLLSPPTIYSLSLTVNLPKASLVGQGISLSAIYGYSNITATNIYPDIISLKDIPHSMVLKIHDLRIHCLIGVNPNERLAKQIVIVNVDFERWNRIDDNYVELEDVIVKVCIILFILIPCPAKFC
jgi:dihydroneopterin aldolase